MTGSVIAKKANACVSDRVYVSHPDRTAVVYISDHEDGGGYVGWLATIAVEDEDQEDCGPLELPNGEFFVYADDRDDLSLKLELTARRLRFEFAQIIELTAEPRRYCITEL